MLEGDRTRKHAMKSNLKKQSKKSPSWYKLAMELLSVQDIFFSLTVSQLLSDTFSFIQTRLGIRKDKIGLFLIYLLFSAGGIWHTYHIFPLIISGELVSPEHYKLVDKLKCQRLGSV